MKNGYLNSHEPKGYMIAATQKADASTGPIVAIATRNFDGATA